MGLPYVVYNSLKVANMSIDKGCCQLYKGGFLTFLQLVHYYRYSSAFGKNWPRSEGLDLMVQNPTV